MINWFSLQEKHGLILAIILAILVIVIAVAPTGYLITGYQAGVPSTWRLSVTVVSPNPGTVVSSPEGINCRLGGVGTCRFSYPVGTSVTLTATPDSGFSFSKWVGSYSGTENPLSLTMNTNKIVLAYFTGGASQTPSIAMLTAEKTGGGPGTITTSPAGTSCGYECWTFSTGTQVTLTAAAGANSRFTGWSGTGINCPGTGTCPVTMDSTKRVIANFVPMTTLTINVNKEGTSSGKVDSDPTGVSSCGLESGNCNAQYVQGTQVTLTPTPGSGSKFSGWGGTGVNCPGTGTCIVNMASSKSITAAFAPQVQQVPAVTDTTPPTVTVTRSPSSPTVVMRQTVTFTATASDNVKVKLIKICYDENCNSLGRCENIDAQNGTCVRQLTDNAARERTYFAIAYDTSNKEGRSATENYSVVPALSTTTQTQTTSNSPSITIDFYRELQDVLNIYFEGTPGGTWCTSAIKLQAFDAANNLVGEGITSIENPHDTIAKNILFPNKVKVRKVVGTPVGCQYIDRLKTTVTFGVGTPPVVIKSLPTCAKNPQGLCLATQALPFGRIYNIKSIIASSILGGDPALCKNTKIAFYGTTDTGQSVFLGNSRGTDQQKWVSIIKNFGTPLKITAVTAVYTLGPASLLAECPYIDGLSADITYAQ